MNEYVIILQNNTIYMIQKCIYWLKTEIKTENNTFNSVWWGF